MCAVITDDRIIVEGANDWFSEFRTYHRKDGRVVKERDDLMSATRYACMMLRHAQPLGRYRR
jgi:hypothetical protein